VIRSVFFHSRISDPVPEIKWPAKDAAASPPVRERFARCSTSPQPERPAGRKYLQCHPPDTAKRRLTSPASFCEFTVIESCMQQKPPAIALE
jgi:hypothetical protein